MPVLAFAGSLNRRSLVMPRARGNGISSFDFDPASGQLRLVSCYGAIDNPSFLALDAPRRRLYAVAEMPDSAHAKVWSFAIDPDLGTLTPINAQPVQGNMACHIMVSGDMLFVSNFSIGKPGPGQAGVVAFPLDADGGILAASTILPLQPGSHPHSTTASADGRHILIADLGLDRVTVHARSANGFHPQPSHVISMPPGSGPRHLAWGPGGAIYVLNELACTIATLSGDSLDRMTFAASISTLSEDCSNFGKAAEIVISDDLRFVYASNRGPDTIAALRIGGTTGQLTSIGQTSSQGATPRNMAIAPSGRHLLVANQDSDEIIVFALDTTTGMIGPAICRQSVGTPMRTIFGDFSSEQDPPDRTVGGRTVNSTFPRRQ